MESVVPVPGYNKIVWNVWWSPRRGLGSDGLDYFENLIIVIISADKLDLVHPTTLPSDLSLWFWWKQTNYLTVERVCWLYCGAYWSVDLAELSPSNDLIGVCKA